MTVDLTTDPRWRRLHDNTWICPCCGESHGGLFELVKERPGPCPRDLVSRDNSEFDYSDNILTEDFCIVNGEHYFIRCLLEIPIIGAPNERLGWGVWSTLSETNFDLYADSFNSGKQSHLGPWFGWFSNRLPGYPDTANLQCHVYPQDDRLRPLIELEPTDHPLAVEQRDGITLDRILELYALIGHDMGDALSA